MSNAGQAALGIVGGVVGFLAGGPTGALYGFQIGLALGSVVSPTQLPGTFGPRLQDKRTTTASLGGAIAEVFGTDVVAGTVIWLGDVNELATTEEVGGKGGPEGENTTYSYTQSIAIGLCRGPIAGVTRIWENGKCVFDGRLVIPGVIETPEEFLARISASVAYFQTLELYTGSETQLPDPTIEAKEGIGNVPAYRGLAYVVYRDRALRDEQGLRHPSFKFEIDNNAADSAENLVIPSILMLTSAQAGIDPDSSNPYVLLAATNAALPDPDVIELQDTYNDAAIGGSDICGKGAVVFAVGYLSATQFWARYSDDAGQSFAARIVAPVLGDTPTQVAPRSCDISDNDYTIVVTGDIEPGSTPTIVVSGIDAEVWLSANTAAVESDFRFGVVRYIEPLDIWVCGGYRGIAKSADGSAWTSKLSGQTNFNPIGFAYGAFNNLACLRKGSIWTSTDDGETWAPVYTDGFTQRALVFGNFVWLRYDAGLEGVIDPGFSIASDLAGPWTPLAQPANWDIYDLMYKDQKFIAVGRNSATEETLIGTSSDGLTWTLESQGHVPGAQIQRIQFRRSSLVPP